MNKIYVHRIDGEDKIIHVNDDWLAFAVENDTPGLTREAVLNKPLFDFIEGRETRYVFRELFAKVRRELAPVTIPFRCDSTDCIRVMEMDVLPLMDEQIQFNCRLIRQEAREPIALLDPEAERSGQLLVVCSWCKKVLVPDKGWLEMEDAVRELDFFGEKKPPRITHEICQPCNARVFGHRIKT